MLKKQVELKKENSEFRQKLKHMERKLYVSAQELNELHQFGRRECIEIVGIPKLENKNTEDVAIKVFSEIGVKINRSEITACQRLPSRKGILVIITKFMNRKSANEILSKRRKLKGKTASDLGFEIQSGDKVSKVFLNESLMKQNKKLYRCVLEKAKERQWKFTWTWNGHIYTRKDQRQPYPWEIGKII